ncbi:anti-sigma factor [Gordonia sp. PDNC005]|uniref:anti-sigma factor n=1 Tax=unclassified Gordonia (in: high G+C Gram-positive bacteria) TaxID=2657482 RepID=UPI00196364D2|nr:anti-sigma factor [Gordonia sp. PDNC005]QRY63477.1 anti-sigma factor [Gordonia sp. PDNC005]
MTTDEHPLDALGALAVDAVDDVERRRLLRHVDDCPSCGAELDNLRQAAAMLSTDVEPVPDHLRSAVLAATYDPRSSRDRRAARLIVAAAVGLVVVAGGVGAAVWSSHRAADSPAVVHDDTIAQVLAAPDMEKSTGEVGGGTIAAMYAPSMRATVVTVADLPATEPAMGYQVWITVGGRKKSAGVVHSGSGDTSVLMADMDRPGDIGLSVEPMTGSHQPSSPMVVTIPMR